MYAGPSKTRGRSLLTLFPHVSQSITRGASDNYLSKRAGLQIDGTQRTNAHRRLHACQLGLIHICGCGGRVTVGGLRSENRQQMVEQNSIGAASSFRVRARFGLT